MKISNLLLLAAALGLAGCGMFQKLGLPDKRTAYEKSQDMAVLEVPPDLTLTRGEYQALIPGEAESTTLSEFERQRDRRLRRGSKVLGSGEFEDEQWLALRGGVAEIWPDLREFWREQGYAADLDDAELGVLETAWKEDGFARNKFRVSAEPDEDGVILFLSGAREERSEGVWFPVARDPALEKRTLREISRYFYGEVETAPSSLAATRARPAAPASSPRAVIQSLGEGKFYLVLPREFSLAWRDTEALLKNAGYSISHTDPAAGVYHFLYFRAAGQTPKKGFWGVWARFKAWADEEAEDAGIPYQLSLTGVGDTTELIVMDGAGEWLGSAEAGAILETLKDGYNRL